MHHSKELVSVYLCNNASIVFYRCTVSFNICGPLHTTGTFSCYRIIIIFESESFKPGIIKTTK